MNSNYDTPQKYWKHIAQNKFTEDDNDKAIRSGIKKFFCNHKDDSFKVAQLSDLLIKTYDDSGINAPYNSVDELKVDMRDLVLRLTGVELLSDVSEEGARNGDHRYLTNRVLEENISYEGNVLNNVRNTVSKRNDKLLQTHKNRDCAKKYQLDEIMNGFIVVQFYGDKNYANIGTYSSRKDTKRLYPIKQFGIGKTYLLHKEDKLSLEGIDQPFVLIEQNDTIAALTNEEFTFLLYCANVGREEMKTFKGKDARSGNRYLKH